MPPTEARGARGMIDSIGTNRSNVNIKRACPLLFSRRWRLEVTLRHDFAAGPRDQRGQDADVEANFQEAYRAIRHRDVGPAGVKAVDLAIVRAVDGAGPGRCSSIGGSTPDQVACRPRPAGDQLPRHRPAVAPELGPSGALRIEDRIRRAVGDVRYTATGIHHEDAVASCRLRYPAGLHELLRDFADACIIRAGTDLAIHHRVQVLLLAVWLRRGALQELQLPGDDRLVVPVKPIYLPAVMGGERLLL